MKQKKRNLLTVIAVFGMTLMLAASVHAAAISDFTDVSPTSFYYDAVDWAVTNGLTKGTSATEFSPDRGCTRAQIVTFLYMLFGKDAAPTTTASKFTDVLPDKYYYQFVGWAVDNGIAGGTGATTFNPDGICTRGQAVFMLCKAFGTSLSKEASVNPFYDVITGNFFYHEVMKALRNGISTGTGVNTFSPNQDCTRAQIVTMLYQAEQIRQTGQIDEPKGEPLSGTSMIRSAMNTDRELNVNGSSTAGGALIRTYAAANINSQKFTFERIPDLPQKLFYRIKTHAGLYLSAKSLSVSSGMNVVQSASSNSLSQIWLIKPNGNGTYTLFNAANTQYAMCIGSGNTEYNQDIVLKAQSGKAPEQFFLTPMVIQSALVSSADHDTLTVKAAGGNYAADDGTMGLFAVQPYESSIKSATPLATASSDGSSVSFTASVKAAGLTQKKFYLGARYNGVYRIISNGFYITNPEAIAENTAAFPVPARGTKKGLKIEVKSAYVANAVDLNCSHVVLDVDLAAFYDTSKTTISWAYNGKTYTFSSNINGYRNLIRSYNAKGICVTLVVYMSRAKATSDSMEPAARSGSNLGSAISVGWNTKDSGRMKVEALLDCVAHKWTNDGALVGDWVFGNEVDQYIQYNYSGDISYTAYHEALSEQYRMFNTAVKSSYANARTYISTDHNWNLKTPPAGTYNGKGLIDNLYKDLQNQGMPGIGVSLHPYPSPEQDCRIWNVISTVTNSGDTQQYTPMNMGAVAAYLKASYGSGTPVIASECGLSSQYNGINQQNEQAAAVALAYYEAEFCKDIDQFAIHREFDRADEMNGGWYLGLYGSAGWSSPKPSADVFRSMDTKNWSQATAKYLQYVKKNGASIGSWKDIVSGFDGSIFP